MSKKAERLRIATELDEAIVEAEREAIRSVFDKYPLTYLAQIQTKEDPIKWTAFDGILRVYIQEKWAEIRANEPIELQLQRMRGV